MPSLDLAQKLNCGTDKPLGIDPSLQAKEYQFSVFIID
jgi:hypothetical protein